MASTGFRSSTERSCRVLVVDDDAMVRGWIREVLADTEFEVVGEASTAAAAEHLRKRRAPDLILLDYRLGSQHATSIVQELRKREVGVPVLLMTAAPVPGLNESAAAVGAQGAVVKTGSAEDLVAALRTVTEGLSIVDARHPRGSPGVKLTPREREVLHLIAEGMTNVQVARELGVSANTVKTLLSRASSKLGTSRRAQTVAQAQRLGLVEP